MPIATITCAKDLLLAGDSDFIGLIRYWEQERRCPAPLVDLLLENGLYEQAEAARWAASKADDFVYGSGETELSGPYAWYTETSTGNKWVWWGENDGRADNIPYTCICRMKKQCRIFFGDSANGAEFDTFAEAVCGLLDCLKMSDFD